MACYGPVNVAIRRKPAAGSSVRVLDMQLVACGSCLGCRTDQARHWAVRMMHEYQMQKPAWFVTMTYSPEFLPEFGSLSKRDAQLFLKRLRKHFSVVKYGARGGKTRVYQRLSYYLCGEYGEKFNRPHYHMVLFGVKFLDRQWMAERNGQDTFVSETLSRVWGKGWCDFTGVTFAGARYVANYVRKKVVKSQDEDAYLRVDPETGVLCEVEPEFALMSRNPALGLKWIERYWREVYPKDRVVMDGQEYKPPRYYDKWMDKHHPEVMYDVRVARSEEFKEVNQATLDARRKHHEKRVSLFQSRGGAG